MVTHTEFNEAQLPQERLRLFHLLEPLFGHFQPIGHARGQTGRGRQICRGQTQLSTQFSDVLLRQPRLHQGAVDA